MRQPSENLIRSLQEQKLCTLRAVERCEPCVRRLCHDLPDFDSVWLDALVQNHVLTTWQADRLQTSERLAIADYVLRDQLGRHTFLASLPGDDTAVVLEELPDNGFLPGADSRPLPEVIDNLQGPEVDVPPCLNMPTGIVSSAEDSWMLVSPYTSGWGVDDLLLRGGRMPWQVVAEIGEQILKGIDWLEREELYHGDIVPRNLRLRTDGTAVLVSPFVRRIRQPVVSFSATLQLRDVETLAPELVGNGQFPDGRSELYSAGCLMWQLLTARPPILNADAVNKISRSQAIDIPDVRTIVPDCPEWMARSLMSMTRRSPELRPKNCSEVAKEWSSRVRTGTRRSRSLLRQMPDRRSLTLQRSQRSSTPKLAPVAVLALLLITFTGWGLHRGLVPNPLMVKAPAEPESLTLGDSDNAEESIDVPEGPIPLPKPDAAGVILLRSGATYLARDVDSPADVYLEADAKECAVVLVEAAQPWRISARQIAMSGVQIEEQSSFTSTAGSSATLVCECDVLSVSRSILHAINWQPKTADSSVVSIADSIFSGHAYGLRLVSPPGRIAFRNVLFSTSSGAVRCDVANRRSLLSMNLDRVTQRTGAAFLDVVVASAAAEEIHCELVCGESVLTPESALVRFAGPDNWTRSGVRVDFLLPEQGNPTIVPPAVESAVALDRSLKSLVALNEGQLITDSLLIATPEFASGGGLVGGSVLVDYEGPKLSAVFPGVLADRLPTANADFHHKVTSTERGDLER